MKEMDVLKYVFATFALLGALDRILGNRLKIGEEFEKGIMSAGTLALSMVGMIAIAPLITKLLIPFFKPVSEFLHIDLSFIATFIANDMGGAAVAKSLSDTILAKFNGLVVSSMLGVTICFTIPVALKMISAKRHKEALGGILCGVATLPLGCIVSGLILKIPIFVLLWNLMPVLFVSSFVCLGLILKPRLTRKIFEIVGKAMIVIITAGLAAGIFEMLTDKSLLPYMLPINAAFEIVFEICVILSGVFPLVSVLSRLGYKSLGKIGKIFKISETATLGLITTLANSIPTFSLVNKMDKKGIVINMAFSVSAAFTFGDHLAFTMSIDPSFVTAVVTGKLVSGIAALFAANFYSKFYVADICKDAEHI